MRVAVLGASGFVGSALVETLGDAHDVVAVARRRGSDANVESGRSRPDAPSPRQRSTPRSPVSTSSCRPRPLARLGGLRGGAIVAIAENVARAAGRVPRRSCRSSILGRPRRRRPRQPVAAPAQPARDWRARWPRGSVPVTTLCARASSWAVGAPRFETIRRARRPAAGDGLPALGLGRRRSRSRSRDVVRYLAGVVRHEEALGRDLRHRRPEVHDLPRR